jgi:hypothetical protein
MYTSSCEYDEFFTDLSRLSSFVTRRPKSHSTLTLWLRGICSRWVRYSEAQITSVLTTTVGLAPPYEIHVYPGSGTVDGQRGDHIIISPSYNTTDAEVNMIVDRVGRLVEDFFNASTPSVP